MMEKFFALPEEKQTTIRNAALACFAKHGYEKASINDIASAAGISKASMFQYFGSKPALYEYLLHYCVSQMKKAYDLSILDANVDFFDRVWKASVMKVENLKQFPHVAAFITSAAKEPAEEVRTLLQSTLADGTDSTETMVLHPEDCAKFKRPEDAKLVFQMLILLGYGIVSRCENEMDFESIMSELDSILKMLKRNFYKQEYL